MKYEHIEIELEQFSKQPGMPCGDVFYRKKTEQHTTIILSDGKGHGVKANIAATMNVAYLVKLLDTGFSPRAAFFKLIEMHKKTGSDGCHYSVFSIARILNDGVATLLTYEMPPPIFISPRGAKILDQRKIDFNDSEIFEANCYLKNNEAIMLMSDGITQAGVGRGYASANMNNIGWGSENLCKFINEKISSQIDYSKLSKEIIAEVFKICQQNRDDDISSVIAYSRYGNVSNVWTGPPTDKTLDGKYIQKFQNAKGYKIICGGTTANIFAKNLNRTMEVCTALANPFTPPQYKIDGIDLATEGAVTLNQLYNIIGEKRSLMKDESPVTQLYDYLMTSDKIIFYLGSVNSHSATDIDLIQRGIKSRRDIVPLIAEKLREIGKLVVVEWI